MKKIKNMKGISTRNNPSVRIKNATAGITLIALVVTIIVLIILAGVSISLILGQNGLIDRAKNAGEEYKKAQLKEELEFAILNIQTDKISKGEEITREDLRKLVNIGVIVESVEIPALGEYKDYEFTVDDKYKVTIGDKIMGVKPEGTGTVLTTETVTYGSKVEIKVTASIKEGSIVSITPTNGAVLKTDISNTEKIYEVGKNGTYYFTIESNNERKTVISAKVNNIIEPIITLNIKDVEPKKFTIEVSTDYPNGMVTEYKYYVNEEVVNSGTINTSYTVEGLNPMTKYKVYVEVYDTTGNNLKSNEQDVTTLEIAPPSIVTSTTHEVKEIAYNWETLDLLAEVISNNYGEETNQINNQTEEVTIKMDGNTYILGIGDYTTLNGKQVRIIGFNHDNLTNTQAYGEGKTNTYAGISFEFANLIKSQRINSTASNVGGWGACELIGSLNSTTYDGLDNKKYIKQVSKKYIQINNDPDSVTISNDYLWLLSCSEIWDNGDTEGGYGYTVTKEGEQYKYYANIDAYYSTPNSKLLKDGSYWWLRSPGNGTTKSFGFVYTGGTCRCDLANVGWGIAPGFAI